MAGFDNLWSGFVDDVAFVLRRLRSRPVGTLGIVGMLVVGIAFATVMFVLSDPFMTKPLPYTRADRPEYPLLTDWQARTDLFDGLAAFVRKGSLRVRSSDRILALEAMAISPNFFAVLGVPVPSPTTVHAGDEAWLMAHSAHAFTGETLTLAPEGKLRVAAVLPATFVVPSTPDLIAPLPHSISAGGGNRTHTSLARLRILSPVRLPVSPPRRRVIMTQGNSLSTMRSQQRRSTP